MVHWLKTDGVGVESADVSHELDGLFLDEMAGGFCLSLEEYLCVWDAGVPGDPQRATNEFAVRAVESLEGGLGEGPGLARVEEDRLNEGAKNTELEGAR